MTQSEALSGKIPEVDNVAARLVLLSFSFVHDTVLLLREEVIIMLPPYVNMIFLSATTPNTIDFSDWIGRTKRKPVHVIRTNYRPVPLSHFLWAGLKLHKIMEGKGGFLDKGYNEASKALLPSAATKKGQDSKTPRSAPSRGGSKQLAWQAQGTKQNWMSLIKFLDREGLSPAVVFSFSKKVYWRVRILHAVQLILTIPCHRNARKSHTCCAHSI
jgi:antiviral helicase SKI2